MDPQIFTTMKHQMLDGKEKEIANRSSPLFKVIFISFLYALFTFSANSPCTPKIHSIPLPFTESLTVNNGNHQPLRLKYKPSDLGFFFSSSDFLLVMI